MKFFYIEYKRSIEKIRNKKIILFNKINNLGLNGASVYIIMKYIRKLFIYNCRSDKEWLFSDIIFVNNVIRIHAKNTILITKKKITRFQNGIS
jgi:hypothetical protein